MQQIRTIIIAMVVTVGVFQAHAESAKKAHEHKEDAYPLKTCVVSGESLTAMGEPYVLMHEGQEVRLCCEDCKGDFLKKPEKYLAKLKKAKAEKATGMEGHGEQASKAKSAAKHKGHEGHNH